MSLLFPFFAGAGVRLVASLFGGRRSFLEFVDWLVVCSGFAVASCRVGCLQSLILVDL